MLKPDPTLAEVVWDLKRALENPALEDGGLVSRALAESPHPWSLLDACDDVVRVYEMLYGINYPEPAWMSAAGKFPNGSWTATYADLPAWAPKLKAEPGKWLLIAEFEFHGPSNSTDAVYKKASNMADAIRRGMLSSFQPIGSFEAAVRTVREQDALRVWARYVETPRPRPVHGAVPA